MLSFLEMCYQFQELTSENDWSDAWILLSSLKPSLDRLNFLSKREELKSQGYMLFGLKKNQKLMTVSGAVFSPHIIDKSNFWIVDMVTLPEYRSLGSGVKMLSFLEEFANKNGCKRLIVHSKIERDRTHEFYRDKSGFNDYAYLFSKELE